jgi:light-regulated signal transduction histidine kinase (bacteriophytochrome)
VDTVLKKIMKPNIVQVVIPEKAPIIKGDKYRLEKLFFHILDNAVKYNNNETVLIKIGHKEQSSFGVFIEKTMVMGLKKNILIKSLKLFKN